MMYLLQYRISVRRIEKKAGNRDADTDESTQEFMQQPEETCSGNSGTTKNSSGSTGSISEALRTDRERVVTVVLREVQGQREVQPEAQLEQVRGSGTSTGTGKRNNRKYRTDRKWCINGRYFNRDRRRINWRRRDHRVRTP